MSVFHGRKRKLNTRRIMRRARRPIAAHILRRVTQKALGLSSDLKANARMLDMVIRYRVRCYHRDPRKQKLVWVNLPSVIELYYAFDVLPFMPEVFGGLMAALGRSDLALDQAYSTGYSRDSCTYCNHSLGAAQLGQLPRPDWVCSTMLTTCDAQGKSFEAAALALGVDFHQIALPTKCDSPAAVDFLVGELETLVSTLESITGTPLNCAKLREVMVKSNAITRAFVDVLETRKSNPPPMPSIDGFHSIFPMYNYCGDMDATLEHFTLLAAECRERLEHGRGLQPTHTRLLSAGHYFPLHDKALLEELDREGVGFVAELFCALYWTEIDVPQTTERDALIRALATRYLQIPTIGSLERRAEICRKFAEEWYADGVVHFLPWGCRMLGSGTYAMADYLKREAGIPTLVVDGDPLDRSMYSKGSVRTRIHAFLEILDRGQVSTQVG